MPDTTSDPHDERVGGLPLTRIEAFSDGVFAIAITLLVLEIGVPLSAERDLLAALAGEWPAYLGYLISFLTVGWVWIGHAPDVAGGLPGVHLESAWRTGPQWSRRDDRMKVRTSGLGPTGGMRT
jgi:hypothetical protein